MARYLGYDANFARTAFGPTNVSIHRVNVAAELGDMGAITGSGPLGNLSALPTERRVRYNLDLARALNATGRRAEAEEALLRIEREASEHVRRHHISRKMVRELMATASGKPSIGLGSLARRMQISEAGP